MLYLGDRGEKFYVILKGVVYVLVAKEVKMLMTEEEYLSYLERLHNRGEYLILNKCCLANRKTFNYDPSHLFGKKAFIRHSMKINDENVTAVLKYNEEKKTNYSDYFDYIEKTRPIHNSDKINILTKLYNLKVWQYYQVLMLKTGEYFGDAALLSNDGKR